MPGRKASGNVKKELAGSNSFIYTSKGERNTGQRSNYYVTKKQKHVKKQQQQKEEFFMMNLLTKMKRMSLVAVCLTLVLGVMGICGVTAKAYSPVTMQTIYTNNEKTEATLEVKVAKDNFVRYGVTLICKNPNIEYEGRTFIVTPSMGTYINFGNENYATWYYSYDENCYVITFHIKRSTIPVGARAYFKSGDAIADNGGYGYYLFE